MNLEFLLSATDGKLFKIMADMTDKLLSKRMDIIVQQGKQIFHALPIRRRTAAEPPKSFLYSSSERRNWPRQRTTALWIFSNTAKVLSPMLWLSSFLER